VSITPSDASDARRGIRSMSLENHAGDPRDRGSAWGLIFSLTAIAAMLLLAGRLYIDLYR
jgi:hypothetical protein